MLRIQLTLMICSRGQKEFEVFCELMKMVPGLEARLMTSSEDEVIHIADLVGPFYISSPSYTYILMPMPDSERCRWRPCGRYERCERRYNRLDYTERPVPESPHSTEQQGCKRVQPWTYRSSPLPCGPWLEEFGVCFFFLDFLKIANCDFQARDLNWSAAKFRSRVTNGPYFYMQIICTIQKTPGTACFEAASLFRFVLLLMLLITV